VHSAFRRSSFASSDVVHRSTAASCRAFTRRPIVKRGQVVAYRTFLRTLLHELCHHLDYDLLRLRDSLHTQGFYQRESSLFHALDAGRVDAPTSIEG